LTYRFLLLACVGVVWAILVRTLLLRSKKHHKTHYKLSEGAERQSGGGGGGGGGSGLGTNNLFVGQVLGGRERMRLEVQPLAVKTRSVYGLPWMDVLRSPPVM
jgi:hypothetical protein